MAVLDNHVLGVVVGGYIECSCGWPNREQWEADEHPVVHIIAEHDREVAAKTLRDAALSATATRSRRTER